MEMIDSGKLSKPRNLKNDGTYFFLRRAELAVQDVIAQRNSDGRAQSHHTYSACFARKRFEKRARALPQAAETF